jgi:RHS repeat-associated protein
VFLQVQSANTGSTINLSGMTSFNGGSLLVATNGTVLDGNLTSLTGVGVTLDGTGTMATDQWATLTSGSITLTGGSYTFPGLSDIDSSSFYTQAGTSLTIPGVSGYTSRKNFATTTFQATGSGSLLSLPNLASLGVSATYPGQVQVQALSGGDVELPALTGNTVFLQVQSANTGSTINLSGMTSFNGGSVSVATSGTVLDANLTSLNGVGVTLDGTGTMATDQWATLTSGSITLTGGSYTFPGLTDIDSSSFYTQWGTSLTIPGVSSYTSRKNFATTTFQATGSGSLLSLPNLASLGVSATYPGQVQVQALSGGDVELPALTGNTVFLQVESANTGSTINLSGMTSFNGGSVSVATSGTVLDGNLTSLNGVGVTLDGTGTMATDQWATLTSGSITLTGGSYTFPGLSDIDSSSFYAQAGTSLTIPGVSSYTSRNNFATTTFQATGSGSLLSLPNLASLGVSATYPGQVQVQALSGGDVELPALTGNTVLLQVQSADAGSTINLSGFTTFNGGSLTITQGGTVIAPNLATLINVTITTDPTGTFTLPANQTFSFPSGTTIFNTGTLLGEGNLDLGGSAAVDVQGGLTINGQGGLSVSTNSTLQVSGSVLGNTTNAAAFNPLGTVVLDSGNGTSNPPQQFEVMSQDLGNVPAGFVGNFAYGTLELTANTYAELVDYAANSPGGTPEALYVNTLIVPSGAVLDLDGLHLYAQTEEINGTIVSGSAVISGEVYDDISGSGSIAPGDPGLAGWTVNLTNTATGDIITTTTDSNGNYTLSGVTAGSYTLSEVVQPGFVETQPTAPGTYSLTVASGQAVSGENFGDHPAASSISGQVFNDVTGSGTYASGDQGLSGWTIDLLNSAFSLVATAQTDANGNYTLSGVEPGTYIVEEVLQSGYIQTTAPATYNVTTVDGQNQTGLNFGDFQLATFSGEVFDDLNDDGTLDAGDPGLAGWTIDLLNSASKVVATSTTDSNGDYSFSNVGPGGYSIAEVLRPGYVQTAPSSGVLTVTASSGATFTAQDIGVFKAVSLAVSGLATTPATGLQSGMSLVVQWTDTNTGTQPAAGSFSDQVVITNTTTGSVLATAYVQYDAASQGNLAAGASATEQYAFSLPDGTPGAGQILFTVTADYYQNVSTPAGEPNNAATLTETSTLAAYPDLVTSAVTATSTAYPGEQTAVDWTLTNSGSATAAGPWTEQVLLATDSAGDNPTLLAAQSYPDALAAGQSVPRSINITIPNLPPGNYWFVVSENPLGEVFELDTANNTAVAAQPTSLAGGLALTLAATTVSDAAGPNATTATVTRNTDTTNSLQVTIANSDPNDVTAPQTVTIPAGATSVTFPIGAINNHVVEGTQMATLTASATGEVSGSGTLTVTDTNVPTLTVVLNNHDVNETDTNPATYGTVTSNDPAASPLTVSLVSNAINKLTVPATVTIPVGATSATFPVTVVNDQQIDGNLTVTITASAVGFQSGTDSAVVVDDNVPTLNLALAQTTVSEAAGADAATGTVSIASPAIQPITIALSNSDTTAATVPAHVVINSGQTSASFPIAAVDDGLDYGDKTAIITASVETFAGIVIIQGSAETSLLLKEADGLALSLRFSPPTVERGATATATVTRDSDTTDSLVVTLSSSDAAKATVPSTVTIPAGQTSVSFTVDTINDGIPDGLQQVQISAAATGLDTGIATLSITDVALPDLVVSSVTAPSGGYDNTPLTVSWTVTNNGLYPATGLWVDQIYLDPAGGPQSTTPADSVTFTGAVNAGQSYMQSDTIPSPSNVGQYMVRVVIDTGQSVQELSYSDNTGVAAQPFNDQAAYTATVTASATVVSAGTPVVLSGAATLAIDGAAAGGVPVAVGILVAGTTRTLTATTDASGNYSVTFQPLPNEAGEYSVTAADAGVTNPTVQAQFQIVGMTASPPSANVTIVPNTPLTGQFTLTNLSNVTLTGLTATASGGPANLTVQLTPPSQIAGDGTATLGYSLDDTSSQGDSGVVTLQVTTAQGAVLSILLGVTVAPLTPALATNPGYLNSGMVVGSQSLVSFTLVNNGGAPSGDLQVSLPPTSFMTLASPATIPSLAPGASSTVTVELTPPADLPLEQYKGTIGIGGAQTGISVPFTFTAITTATGTVSVLVDDDYTFDTPGMPRVQGATVNLLNPYDNSQVVETGVTDATGAVTFTNVPAGPYDLQVQAQGHSSYESSFTVVPGITNSDEVFIHYQFVTYTWNVVPTTIQDMYQLQLQTTFQTDVPAPVVTITAPASIPTLVPGQSASFNVTITNHGLIAAQGVTLDLPTDPEYTFTALSTDIGVLPAQSSVVVPITVTRVAPQSLSISDGGTTLTANVEVPNPVGPASASTVYVNYSNTGNVAIPAPLLLLTATQGSSQGAFLSLNSSLAGLAYNSNATPSGFSDTVQFLASGATPGMLEPGESVQIPVYYGGWLSSQWSGAPVTFSLSEVSADNTQPIDWPSAAPGLRPISINVAAWNAITPILATQMGSTWGQYVQTLDSDAAYLAGIGDPTTGIAQLLSFELEKANGAFGPQTLVSVTTDSLPAPGMNLTFVQSFQQSIAGRYTEGILGFGWRTNWDMQATAMTNGDVAIEEDGTSRYFSLEPNDTYAPQAGDEGTTLTATGGAYQLVEKDGTIYQFNANGTLDYVQDTRGNSITAGYNAQGQLISLTHSNGEFLDLAYNAQGHVATLTDSNGQTETYGYDSTGQFLTSYTDFYGTTNYTYVAGESAAQNNALAQIAYADNTHIYFGYDSQGRLTDQHRDGGQEDLTWTYLSPGGYVTTDANGNQTTVYFNLFNAAAVTIDALGNVTRTAYDSNLNLTKLAGPGGSNDIYTYTYDANGSLTSETDPLLLTTTFAYDSHNNLSSFTDAKLNTTSYAYDSENNLLSVNYADGTQQSYTYNPLGEATQYMNQNSQAIGYTYNAQGLVATESFADGTSYSYTYSPQGNVTSATNSGGTITFTYGDSSNPNLLTEVQYPDGTWLKLSYNVVGQRTQSVDQTGFTVNYSYDPVGRLSKLTDGSGNLIVQYTYDSAGNLIQKDVGNGTRTVYTYDKANAVLSITNYGPDHVTVNSFDSYTYDALGNVLTDTNQDGEWVYSYDADGQLIQAVFTPNSTNPDGLTAQDLQYVYDAAGNRISETVNSATTTYVTNDINEYTSSTTNGVATNYQYDADGNLIAQSVGGSMTSYSFNELNQLTAVNGPNVTASYGYDPLGNRISQTVNGVTTNYQIDPAGLGNVVATFGTGGALTAHYTYGFGLVGQVSAAGTVGYCDFNSNGSIVGITGSGGSYVNKYAYLPFGQTTTLTAAVVNPFTFAGQAGVMQAGTTLFAMGARDYSPVTGEFLSNDPTGLEGGDLNVRRYVRNNPVTYADPSGLGYWMRLPVWRFGRDWGHPQYYPPGGGNGTGQGYGPGGYPWPSPLPPGATILGGPYNDTIMQQAFQYVNSHGSWGPNTYNVVTHNSWTYYYNVMAVYNFSSFFGRGGGGGGGAGCPTQTPPIPPKPPAGAWTRVIGGSYYYYCLNNQVFSGFVAPIGIPGRDCSANDVASAVASDSAIVTALLTTENCNPLLNSLGQLGSHASSDASDPPADTAPPVAGTDQAASAAGPSGNPSPLTFVATALANLGLINGQSGNDGYTPAQAAQMVSTIATFDQVESDLAGIFATASGQGASLGIAGDIALLRQVDSGLSAVTTAENLLFGGDANWLNTNQSATLQQWMSAFLTDAQNSSDGSGTITSDEVTQLLATTLPSTISSSEAMEFIDRWNRTVQYWSQGIFTAAQVPAGQSTDFLDIGAIQTAFNAAMTAEQESQLNGYSDVGAQVQGALKQFEKDLAGQGVCATIQLQMDQSATLTRSAFSGTLSITNSEGAGAMINVAMNINITDTQGNPANGEFYVSSPTYSGAFSVVGGVATLPDYSTGSISFTFIPSDSAAPSAPTQYLIGGTIAFTAPSGVPVTIPVFPSTITVYPQAELQLNYFLQTDVVGDNPFTPQVEPSEPAVLGLLVTNVGAGTANNLSITTAQPQIIQNEKGLLDAFQIIGTQVGNQQETPSLTVDFGDIAPGQTADASFLLLSSLQGVFDNFTATFSHSDALGGTETSLIKSVVTHSLVHAGNFNYPDSTGATDYLVDDNPNPQGLPDTIYFSDGTTTTVNIATGAAWSQVGSSSQLTFQVTASATSGWDYIQLPDPGAGYTLYKVVRSDGTVIPVSDQAWQTDVTFSPTGASTPDYELHILDDNSTGSYVAYYRPTVATAPTVASISSVSSPQSGAIGSVDIAFSEAIDPSTFTTQNLSLTLNGGTNLIGSSVTITQDSPTTFTIGGLTPITGGDGNYLLIVSAAGVSDFFGDIGSASGSLSTAWATGTNVPVIVSVGAGNPSLRNTPVDTVDVVLSEPIEPGSFDYQALSLTLDGGPNLITSAVTVTEVDSTTYQIGGLGSLTAADGNYNLTVSAAGLVDGSGNTGVGFLSETWTMNTVGPTIASLPTYIQSPRNIVVPAIDVIFSEPINPATFTYQNITYTNGSGPNLILPSITITQLSSTEFEITNFNNLLLPIDGTYTFTVSAAGVMDLAGNTGSRSASDTWVLATSAPAAPTDLAISPNTGASPGVTNTGLVTLTGTLPESGLAVDVMDGNTDLGFATVSGTSFSMTLDLPAGTNQLAVTATDAAGNVSPSNSFDVFVGETPPQISSIAAPAPNPRNTPVDSVDVTFSEAINSSTFTTANLSLTDNGGPNLITSSVTINLVSGSTYKIGGLSGLTTVEGTYVLTVSAAGIQDQAGNIGTGSMSASWLMDTTPPSSTVDALPATTTSTSFIVSVTGSDPSGAGGSAASGIASFDLYTSIDGGAFGYWTTVTPTVPSAVFTGQVGHTYGFYSVATDKAGNVEATPTSAEATTQVVNPAIDTITSVQSSEDPSKLGDSVTFTATVFPDQTTGGTPTGSVQFSIDGAAVGSPVPLDGNGAATFATASLTVGSHTVTASYINANGNFNPSSGTLSGGQTVNTADTTVAVLSSAPTSAYGESITLTATVFAATQGLPTPTGTVEFFDGTTELSAETLDSTATATFSTSLLAVGSHSITVQYVGDANFSGSTSAVLSQTVNQDGTTTSITTSKNPSVYGQSVTFTATVSANAPGSGSPTGTVTFYAGTVELGAGTLNGSLQASFTTSSLAAGLNAITAVYSGDANFSTSTSTVLKQTVTQDGTKTSITSSLNPSVYGQAVTFTATVTANPPGGGTPTGTVTFYDGATVLGKVTLTDGTASLTTSALSVGKHVIKVVYSGNSDFQRSKSFLKQVVNSASSASLSRLSARIVDDALGALGDDSTTEPHIQDLALERVLLKDRRLRHVVRL